MEGGKLVGHKLGKRIAGILLIVVIVAIIMLLRSCGAGMETIPTDTTPPKNTLDFTPAGERQDNTITIPGMTGITMKSGQLQQTVDFYNPERNACYFVLSLYLSDDTLIFQSDFLAPGEHISEIVLNQALQRGVYGKCRLVYECFTLDDKCALNTGEVILEINST